MIETDVCVPFTGRMALLARAPESAAVYVIGTMAPSTFDRQLLIFDNGCVASVAVKMRVCALEREFETRMIKCIHMPGFIAVAFRATSPEAAAMTIIAAMAAGADLGYRILKISAAVAIGAADMGVRPFECKTGLTSMIELR